MDGDAAGGVVDTLTLRFVGEEKDGTALRELRAAHVAEVLQGLVALSSDFAKAGALGDGPAGSEMLVRPPREGSFEIEVLRFVQDNWEAIAAGAGAVGLPSLSTIIWWATRAMRADVKDFEYLENDRVKVVWQDDTAEEIPRAAWDELRKRKRRRKKQLRQIMAPLSDERVASVDVQGAPADEIAANVDVEAFTLTKPDYDAVRSDDEIDEHQDVFDIEAQMSAIDFDDPTRWKVKAKDTPARAATVEDEDFLGRIAGGLAIRKSDIFRLRVREDTVVKNGRTRRKWTVLKVESHRRAAHDDD